LLFKLITGLSDKINMPIRFVQYKGLFLLCFFMCVFLYGESGSCLTRVVASGVSWAVGVTQRPASVTLFALGKLELAYNPCTEKNFT